MIIPIPRDKIQKVYNTFFVNLKAILEIYIGESHSLFVSSNFEEMSKTKLEDLAKYTYDIFQIEYYITKILHCIFPFMPETTIIELLGSNPDNILGKNKDYKKYITEVLELNETRTELYNLLESVIMDNLKAGVIDETTKEFLLSNIRTLHFNIA